MLVCLLISCVSTIDVLMHVDSEHTCSNTEAHGTEPGEHTHKHKHTQKHMCGMCHRAQQASGHRWRMCGACSSIPSSAPLIHAHAHAHAHTHAHVHTHAHDVASPMAQLSSSRARLTTIEQVCDAPAQQIETGDIDMGCEHACGSSMSCIHLLHTVVMSSGAD